MQFKLQKTKTELGQTVFIVYPRGYDHSRGFSTLALAFDYMRAILASNK
jgi:hypothetical protein